ncbi:hypothetical protein JET18_18495 [Chryseobacterium sp. L7]|uniref:Uncharacterized protein n=1 Tax=Chryseobacterium endalhagicum TaxID=2797638 RepID=A0ABS1QKR3_9FLAO|nr:hypothetical protein [Chryseobacterium endalhagicum]MBL1222852.1 hypothetical protein [Chryseobacterium endalhagicum]
MKTQLAAIAFVISAFSNAQVGIGTNTPGGAFHVDGNKDNAASPTAAQTANDFIVTSTGSAALGTITPDASAKFQINATDKGMLIPRVALTAPNDAATILSPAKGLIVYNTNVNTNMEEGFYTNYGTPAVPKWITYQQRDKTAWKLDNVFDVTATAPVDQTVTATTAVNNINLGLSITITVPAFTQAKLVTTYSVPMGTTAIATSFGGYFGVRFLKNGTELPAGSRKYTVPAVSSSASSRMASVNATVGDTVTNNTASPVNVTYALNGYVEPTADTATIRFNMWSTADPNFNWGRGYMSVQMFTKTTL